MQEVSKTILTELNQFTGTENYYRNFTGLLYTDGIKFLADKLGCYWLIDLVGSYQQRLRNIGFQLWKIEVNEDNSAVVTCKEDTGRPDLVRQELPYTDFKIKELELYCINGVLLLKSEY